MFGASGVRIADVLDFCSTLCPDDETGLFFFLDCYDFAVHVCGLIGLLDSFACEGGSSHSQIFNDNRAVPIIDCCGCFDTSISIYLSRARLLTCEVVRVTNKEKQVARIESLRKSMYPSQVL